MTERFDLNLDKNDLPRGFRTTDAEAEGIIAELLKDCRKRFVYAIFDAALSDADAVTVCGSVFKSKDLRAHIDGCGRIALLSATLGTEVDAKLRLLQKTDMTAAVVYDAAANAYIEKLCDLAEREISAAANGSLTPRYGAGYGDFPLSYQKDILRLTGAERKIGLFLTSGGMLAPQKSVTAVIGIGDKRKTTVIKCADCNMRTACNYKKTEG